LEGSSSISEPANTSWGGRCTGSLGIKRLNITSASVNFLRKEAEIWDWGRRKERMGKGEVKVWNKMY